MEAKIEEALHKERDSNEKDNVSLSGSSNNEEKEDFSAVLFRLKKGPKATNLWKTKLTI